VGEHDDHVDDEPAETGSERGEAQGPWPAGLGVACSIAGRCHTTYPLLDQLDGQIPAPGVGLPDCDLTVIDGHWVEVMDGLDLAPGDIGSWRIVNVVFILRLYCDIWPIQAECDWELRAEQG
jgi:hypothetical protein